jgi:hypothetical protein
MPLALGPTSVAVTSSALGADSPEVRARLDLVAPANCATRAELEKRVTSRSDRIRFVGEGERVRALTGEIKPIDDRTVAATLTLVELDGRRSARRVLTHSCEEALDALALVVAVTLDPSSVLRKEPAPEPPPPPPSENPPPPPPSPPPPKPVEVRPTVPVPVAPPEQSAWEASAGLAFEGIYGPPPGILPGGSLYIRLRWERSSALSPALFATASHFERDGYQFGSETADFALNQLRLELCPLRQGKTELAVHYCAMGSGGSLRAGGVQTYGPRTQWRPWWVLGASAVLTVRPTEALEITAALSGGVPLIRDSFQFSSDPFWKGKLVSLTGALGVGLRLP